MKSLLNDFVKFLFQSLDNVLPSIEVVCVEGAGAVVVTGAGAVGVVVRRVEREERGSSVVGSGTLQ